MTTKFEDFLNEHVKAQNIFADKMTKKGKELLSEKFVKFMEDNPEIQAISWTGYTPYFNDGDTCKYGVNEPQFKLTREFMATLIGMKYTKTNYSTTARITYTYKDSFGKERTGYKYPETEHEIETLQDAEDYLDDEWETQGLIENLLGKEHSICKAMCEISDFVCSLGDVCETIFGDHVQITYTRGSDSFEVDHYSHD